MAWDAFMSFLYRVSRFNRFKGEKQEICIINEKKCRLGFSKGNFVCMLLYKEYERKKGKI